MSRVPAWGLLAGLPAWDVTELPHQDTEDRESGRGTVAQARLRRMLALAAGCERDPRWRSGGPGNTLTARCG